VQALDQGSLGICQYEADLAMKKRVVPEPAQNANEYGILIIGYISWKVAAPVARHGEPMNELSAFSIRLCCGKTLPKNPPKKRSTRRPEKLWTKAVGMVKITKIMNVQM
jgi:hypothetical protein